MSGKKAKKQRKLARALIKAGMPIDAIVQVVGSRKAVYRHLAAQGVAVRFLVTVGNRGRMWSRPLSKMKGTKQTYAVL